MAEQTQSAVILTDEQFAFMQAHHEEIERAMIAVKRGDSAPIDAIINLDEYQQLFGAMLWDDVYDRYQETPGYDDALTKALHEQLREDVKTGKITLPRTQNTRKPVLDDKTLSKMGLRKLNE